MVERGTHKPKKYTHPLPHIRISEELFDRCLAEAARQRITLTGLVRKALTTYLLFRNTLKGNERELYELAPKKGGKSKT